MKFNHDIEPLPEGFMDFFNKKVGEQNQMKGLKEEAELAEAAGKDIINTAYEWHGGGGSPLYSFASTGGKIHSAKHKSELESEIQKCIDWVKANGAKHGDEYKGEDKKLAALLAYVKSQSPLKEDIALEEGRSLYVIAREIRSDWKNVNYAAKPYLDAMGQLDSIKDNYYMDSGKSVVAYFLSNATSWRGDKAKAIKAELKAMLKEEVELAEAVKVKLTPGWGDGGKSMKTSGTKVAKGVEDEIRDYYDSHPNLTLQQLASKTGKSVAELKKILMNEGLEDYKRKAVTGLYNYDHFEKKDGSFVQISTRKDRFVHQDAKGNRKEFTNFEDLKKHLKLMGEGTDLTPDTEEEDNMEKKANKSLEEAYHEILTGKMLAEANDGDKDDDGEGIDKVRKDQLKGDFEDRTDKDIDNDGDSDSSDEYLHKRRQAISNALAKESVNEEYNGWTNRETWNVALWMSNDEPSYRRMVDFVKKNGGKVDAAKAKQFGMQMFPNGTPDIRGSGMLAKVDWKEIADSMNEG